MATTEKLLAKSEAMPDGCRVWRAYIQENGYGQVSHLGRMRMVHRVAWQLWVGPIPEGLEIDHWCKNRACINVEHMRTVTHAENMKRADPWRGPRERTTTHCPAGHEYSDQNTYWHKAKRYCRECNRASKINSRSRSKSTGGAVPQ